MVQVQMALPEPLRLVPSKGFGRQPAQAECNGRHASSPTPSHPSRERYHQQMSSQISFESVPTALARQNFRGSIDSGSRSTSVRSEHRVQSSSTLVDHSASLQLGGSRSRSPSILADHSPSVQRGGSRSPSLRHREEQRPGVLAEFILGPNPGSLRAASMPRSGSALPPGRVPPGGVSKLSTPNFTATATSYTDQPCPKREKSISGLPQKKIDAKKPIHASAGLWRDLPTYSPDGRHFESTAGNDCPDVHTQAVRECLTPTRTPPRGVRDTLEENTRSVNGQRPSNHSKALEEDLVLLQSRPKDGYSQDRVRYLQQMFCPSPYADLGFSLDAPRTQSSSSRSPSRSREKPNVKAEAPGTNVDDSTCAEGSNAATGEVLRMAHEKLQAWTSFKQRHKEDLVADAVADVVVAPAGAHYACGSEAHARSSTETKATTSPPEPIFVASAQAERCSPEKRRDFNCPVRSSPTSSLGKKKAEQKTHPITPTNSQQARRPSRQVSARPATACRDLRVWR